MKKIMSKIITMILVIGMVTTSLVYTSSIPVIARTNAELAADKKKLLQEQEDLEKSQRGYSDALSNLETNKASVEEQKEILDKQMLSTQKQIKSLNSIIKELDEQLEEQNKMIEESNKAFESYYALYKERIRKTYEETEKSSILSIFSSNSFTDFFEKAEVASQIVEYDNQLMDKMTEEINKIKILKEGIEQNKKENESSKSLVVIQQVSLDDQISKSNALIASFAKDLETYKNMQQSAESAQKNINNELARIAAENAKNNDSQPPYVYEGGDFLWPLKGFSNISSHFGQRRDPFTGALKTHWGTDISGAGIFGSPAFAMKSGVVILSSWDFYGGGNRISIDHGNNIVTTYMHLNEREVVVGDIVKQGQEIGKVGTTGNSTGPHLHIEFMINGIRVNPMGFFK